MSRKSAEAHLNSNAEHSGEGSTPGASATETNALQDTSCPELLSAALPSRVCHQTTLPSRGGQGVEPPSVICNPS